MYLKGFSLGDAYPMDLEAGDYGYGLDLGSSEVTADSGNWWSNANASNASWDGVFPSGSDTAPTSSVNWTGIVSAASRLYSDFKGKSPSLPGAPAPSNRPVSSPFTGGMAGAGVLTLAALGLGIFALMRKK